MTSEQVRQLMEIGNRARAIRCFHIADAAMAVLLGEYAARKEFSHFREPISLELVWLTAAKQDQNVHDDLLAIRQDDQSLCIPIPLLAVDFALSTLKWAKSENKAAHLKQKSESPKAGEVEALWDSLLAIVPMSCLCAETRTYLNELSGACILTAAARVRAELRRPPCTANGVN